MRERSRANMLFFYQRILPVGMKTKRNPYELLYGKWLMKATHEPWNIGGEYFNGVVDVGGRSDTF